MNKKRSGFTLIELLAVIVILAIIALIAVPIIMNIINKANKSAFKDSAYGVISAGELYFAEMQLEPNGMENDITFELPDTTKTLQLKGEVPTGSILITKDGDIAIAVHNNRYCVTKGLEDKDVKVTEDYEVCVVPGFEKLITNLKLSESSVEIDIDKQPTVTISTTIEPSDATNKTLIWQSSNESVVTVENGIITAKGEGTAVITVTTTDGSNISNSVEVNILKYYTNDIMTSKSNCINTGICSHGTEVKVAVSNIDVYNFYVINDTGSELTLIMDRNLGDRVAWYSDNDNNTNNELNNLGPITALNYLNSKTSNWSNIPTIENYIYDNNLNGTTNTYGYQKLVITDGKGELTSQDGVMTELTGPIRARMLTREEANSLKTINGEKTPDYLLKNLSNLNTAESPYGYWFLTSDLSSSRYGRYMSYSGYTEAYYDVYDLNGRGVRPVITLKK